MCLAAAFSACARVCQARGRISSDWMVLNNVSSRLRRKSVAQDVQRGAFFTPAIFLAEVSDRCSCRAEIGLILGRPGKSLAVRTHLAPIAA